MCASGRHVQAHEKALSERHSVNKANLRRPHTVWCQVYSSLEKVKLGRQWNAQRFPWGRARKTRNFGWEMEKARLPKELLGYRAVAEVNQSSVCGMNRKLDLTRTELQWTWGGQRFKGSVNGQGHRTRKWRSGEAGEIHEWAPGGRIIAGNSKSNDLESREEPSANLGYFESKGYQPLQMPVQSLPLSDAGWIAEDEWPPSQTSVSCNTRLIWEKYCFVSHLD